MLEYYSDGLQRLISCVACCNKGWHLLIMSNQYIMFQKQQLNLLYCRTQANKLLTFHKNDTSSLLEVSALTFSVANIFAVGKTYWQKWINNQSSCCSHTCLLLSHTHTRMSRARGRFMVIHMEANFHQWKKRIRWKLRRMKNIFLW